MMEAAAKAMRVNRQLWWAHQDHRFLQYYNLATVEAMATRTMQREVGIPVVILAAWEIRNLMGQGQA
jgi:hypothetical protein